MSSKFKQERIKAIEQERIKAIAQERIKAIALRLREIRQSLDRKDLNQVVADGLIEEYCDLWSEYWDLKGY